MNEMNPKLKALIAAGLIGTAGLGMQSCSMPVDSGVEVVVNDENTFEGLKVAPEDREILANSHTKFLDGTQEGEHISTIFEAYDNLSGATIHYYVIGKGFTTENIDNGSLYFAYYLHNKFIGYHVYIIPINKKSNFEKAIATYRANHS